MPHTICLIGTFDTKGAEYAFLRERILEHDCSVLTVDVGVLGTAAPFPIDVSAAAVVSAAGRDIEELRVERDRGRSMKAMCAGAAVAVRELYAKRGFDGIIGMGGTGGTSIVTAAMRELPIGVPKVCVSTAAAGDVSSYVGTKDIVMMPAIVDVAGLNRISRGVFARAAAAICGMASAPNVAVSDDRPIIAASMFGNTTECVNECVRLLNNQGYEVLVFHAVGSGGRAMEALVDEGLVDGVLDITTTEWADELCGGVFTAGTGRLDAPGRRAIPHLIVPGCIDMVNFGGPETIPERYQNAGRIFYEWNPSVTLMRTNAEENNRIGKIFADKANAANGPVAFLLPLKGLSILDGDEQLFCDRESDAALFRAIRDNVREGIEVEEMDVNINDARFAAKAVEMMLGLLSEPSK